MKANAPENIYIFENPILDFSKLSQRQSKDDIEYVRTDAFIEKACLYIRLHSALLDTENNDCMPEWLDKFRDAMKK